ncbi:MAG: prenyltransferase [Nitrososphaerota archaeon]|nr:prenyltransferase [Nitrososphaerota archaeon]
MSDLAPKQVSNVAIFFRLTRAQFIPLIILPSLAGASFAYFVTQRLNLGFLLLNAIGVVLLHLGANSIDDCYDYLNKVDRIADEMFPPNFGGWKPLPRGLISLKSAKTVSYLLFVASLLCALYFTFVVGFWAILFGVSGVLLAIFYTAPPLKLDYSGYGLGELAILLAFGPIPMLGSYYVQTGALSLSALFVSIPIGIMTVTILIDHDLIFYEVYLKAGKMSLATVLGRKRALHVSLILTLFSYGATIALLLIRVLPIQALAAPVLSGLLLARKVSTYAHPNEPPPYYLPFTVNGMLANWTFSLVLAVALLL